MKRQTRLLPTHPSRWPREARFNDGAWHHVVARRRRASGELRLEVDGVVVGSKVGGGHRRARGGIPSGSSVVEQLQGAQSGGLAPQTSAAMSWVCWSGGYPSPPERYAPLCVRSVGARACGRVADFCLDVGDARTGGIADVSRTFSSTLELHKLESLQTYRGLRFQR